ncbi:MAG: hypothetical protein ACRDV3_04700 [Acidothermaceae bacterium]
MTKLKWPELSRLPELRWLRRAAEGAPRDSGDIILGWLTRIVVGIAIAGIVAFDGLSIGVAHVSAADDANTAARSASHAWLDQHTLNAAVQAAQATASEHDEIVVTDSVHVQTDGTVDLKIERAATTLVVRHIHALHSWLTIVASGSGKYIGS